MGKQRNRNTVRVHEDGKKLLIQALASKTNYKGKKWSQSDVVDASGISEGTVKRFFRGVNVDRKSAEAIVSVLELNLDDLIDIQSSDTLSDESDEFDKQYIPDVSNFFGRTQELATIKQWILQDKYRLITLVGMEGIGKTSLAMKLKEQINDKFDKVIVRSLENAPKLNQLLTSLIIELSSKEITDTSNSIGINLARLENELNKNRYLLFLDNIEEILQPRETLGNYLQGYENYENFFIRVGITAPHQSCLVLLTQKKPQVRKSLEYTLQIKGLDHAAAKDIFKQHGFSDSEDLTKLIHLYQGHPLFLKLVLTTIRDDFGGSINNFLYQGSTLDFGNIYAILDNHFQNLSDLEKEIMCVLASEDRSIPFSQLRTNIDICKKQFKQEGFTNAIKCLNSRGLIKNIEGEASYTLPSRVIINHIRRRLSNQNGLVEN
ncbi:MAG: NB-ARC domain-containing protein [Sphaerospermopsis kisseleviana]